MHRNMQTRMVDPAELKVALWFYVPGRVQPVDWQGFRVLRLNRKERSVEFEIAAPFELPEHRVNAYLHDTLKQVPALAEATLHLRAPRASSPARRTPAHRRAHRESDSRRGVVACLQDSPKKVDEEFSFGI